MVEAFSGLECSLEQLAREKSYRVTDVCEALGCSQRHLYAIFTRDIGLPPKTWMDLERMVVARRMLLSGDSAEQVAEELGFMSVVSFRRKFNQVYRISPGRFVKHPRLFNPDKPPRHFAAWEKAQRQRSSRGNRDS